MEELKTAREQGKYRSTLKRFQAVDLLVLDEWGTTVFDLLQSRDILEIMEALVVMLLIDDTRFGLSGRIVES